MSGLRFRQMLRTALFALLSLPAMPVQTQVQPDQHKLSTAEVASLRPVVRRDLRSLAATQSNDNYVSPADLDRLFRRCRFSRIDLGSLGPAVVVEELEFAGASNLSMINVYVPSGKSWRRVAVGEGFGPQVVPGGGGVPDLVYGWGEGVCNTTFHLYRYHDGSYSPKACDQQVEAGNAGDGNCVIAACEGARKLPTFPNPWPSATDATESTTSTNGPGPCKPAPALDPAVANLGPGTSIQFEIAPRFTGTCPVESIAEGGWTTSDPVDTSVSARGVATCLQPTPVPAIIRYSGSSWGKAFNSAQLNCK